MRKHKPRQAGQNGVDIVEEATHLLRDLPLSAYVIYLVGALPFLAALLYFWADMSHGTQASPKCAPGSLMLTLAFVWLKTWQTVFVSRLREHLSGLPERRWTLARWWRCTLQQAFWQATGFIVLPIAAVLMLPFGWTYAFYQNLSWTGDGRAEGLLSLFARTSNLSKQWTRQNHTILLWIFLFSFFVFLNVLTLFNFLPGMLKLFLGVETTWTLGGWSVFNTTLLMSCAALTWLVIDPLTKAAYALRCFYGEAVATGEDLKAELRALQPVTVALLLMAGLLFAQPQRSLAADAASKPSAGEAQRLNDSIEKVLNQRRYDWRLPPDKNQEKVPEKGWLQSFLESIQNAVVKVFKSIRNACYDILKWLHDLLPKPKFKPPESSGTSTDWMGGMRLTFFLLLLAVACCLGVMLWRFWKRKNPAVVVLARAVTAKPDLADENVSAADLPQNEWFALAQEQLKDGNLRFALRALYLAGLAHLGEKEFLNIARFKSNRDYVVELRRRARSKEDLQSAFGEAVHDFERVWYGMHEVTLEGVQSYQRNVERILSC